MTSNLDLPLPEDDLNTSLEEASAEDLDQVEVKTDRAEGRQREISAHIRLPYSLEQVWQILTDYEHLADFIPNLAKSCRIDHPQGGIRLEQVGTQSLLRIKFCARVVLDMVEQFPNELKFQMVEGDFKSFFGSWQLHPTDRPNEVDLRYVLTVLPPRTMPIGMIERRLKHDLALNLTAIRKRADELYGSAIA